MDRADEEDLRKEVEEIKSIPVISRSDAVWIRLNTLEAEIRRRHPGILRDGGNREENRNDELELARLTLEMKKVDLEMSKVNGTSSGGEKKSRSPTCPTMSSFGSVERLKYKEFLYASVADGMILPPNDSFHRQTFGNEEDMNDALFKTLVSITKAKDDEDGIILINSERTIWLEDPNVPEEQRKPDFLRCHRAFFRRASSPHGTHSDLQYGGILGDFIDQTLSIKEGKVKNIKTDGNIGVSMNYVNMLSNAGVIQPRGILFNQTDLMTIDCETSTLRFGRWCDTSMEEIQGFLLGVKYPALTYALVQACHFFGVVCTLSGYIDKGASAYTFAVHDKSSKDPRGALVLKIILKVRGDVTFEQRVEDEFYRARKANKIAPLITIPVREHGVSTSTNSGAILFEERGWSIVSKALQKRRPLFNLLRQLHQLGYAHGDARVQNIVELKGELKFIDFATFVQLSERTNPIELVVNDCLKLCRSCGWAPDDTLIGAIQNYATTVCDVNASHSDVTVCIENIISAF